MMNYSMAREIARDAAINLYGFMEAERYVTVDAMEVTAKAINPEINSVGILEVRYSAVCAVDSSFDGIAGIRRVPFKKDDTTITLGLEDNVMELLPSGILEDAAVSIELGEENIEINIIGISAEVRWQIITIINSAAAQEII